MEDIYQGIDSLVAELARSGHERFAERIKDAVASGATATEILMAVRWVLQTGAPDLQQDSPVAGQTQNMIALITALFDGEDFDSAQNRFPVG